MQEIKQKYWKRIPVSGKGKRTAEEAIKEGNEVAAGK